MGVLKLSSRYVIALLLVVLYSRTSRSLLRSNIVHQHYDCSTSSPSSINIIQGPLPLLQSINSIKYRRQTCLYGLDLFGLGAPEIVICGLAVAVLYGPDRIKGQWWDISSSHSFSSPFHCAAYLLLIPSLICKCMHPVSNELYVILYTYLYPDRIKSHWIDSPFVY